MSVQLKTAHYTGQAQGFLREGQGQYRYSEDFVYVGNFSKNVKHGHGELSLIGNFKIAGEFRDGEITGSGRKDWASGNSYEGEFVNGELQGQGTLTTKQFSYSGNFQRNQFSGLGRLDGGSSVYEGNFQSHKFHGEGQLTFGNSKFVGNFENGDFNGQGLLSEDSCRHQGEFKDGKRHGPGKAWDEISRYCVTGSWDVDVLINAPLKFLPLTSPAVYLQTLVDDKKKKFSVDVRVSAPFADVAVLFAQSEAMLPSISISVVSEANAKVDDWGRVAELRLVQRFNDGREQFFPFSVNGTLLDFKRFVVAAGNFDILHLQLPTLPKGQYIIQISDITDTQARCFTRNSLGELLLVVS